MVSIFLDRLTRSFLSDLQIGAGTGLPGILSVYKGAKIVCIHLGFCLVCAQFIPPIL